jgi:uncharacterized membrane protein
MRGMVEEHPRSALFAILEKNYVLHAGKSCIIIGQWPIMIFNGLRVQAKYNSAILSAPAPV